MNGSAANVSVIVQYRDSFAKAVIKNVVILAVGIFINYINSSLIHTFCKHQVSGAPHGSASRLASSVSAVNSVTRGQRLTFNVT